MADYHHVEVDFILYGEDGFWAIEVKNTNKVRPADLRSLKTFQQDYPECQTIFFNCFSCSFVNVYFIIKLNFFLLFSRGSLNIPQININKSFKVL